MKCQMFLGTHHSQCQNKGTKRVTHYFQPDMMLIDVCQRCYDLYYQRLGTKRVQG